jgi:glyoxylase-like metal-dependent hydrolase (beta-lactamase superfamily II)
MNQAFRQAVIGMSVVSMLAGTAIAQPLTEVDKHIDAAARIAAGDPLLVDTYRTYYCMFAEDRLDLRTAARQDTGRVPLTQIMDDVWYIGSRYVGQFIFRSPQGFMVVDSLNNAAEAAQYTTPALTSLGISAAQPLDSVYLTHGHGDHDGGATYLKNTYGAKTYLGSGDATGKQYAPITIDSAGTAPVGVVLGGRNVSLLPTPGHSNGSMSAVIPAMDGGRAVNVVVVGGSSMPNDIAGARRYLASVERTYVLAKQTKAEASMHPHPVFDGTLKNLERIQAVGKATPSPFTVGNDRILRGLAIYRACSAAWVAKLDASAVIPVWRTTSLQFLDSGPSPSKISAKLTSTWGPVPHQEVQFSVGDTGATCVTTTNDQGIATCGSRMGPLRPNVDKVTVSFAGASNSEYVDLGTATTATARPDALGPAAPRAAPTR